MVLPYLYDGISFNGITAYLYWNSPPLLALFALLWYVIYINKLKNVYCNFIPYTILPQVVIMTYKANRDLFCTIWQQLYIVSRYYRVYYGA